MKVFLRVLYFSAKEEAAVGEQDRANRERERRYGTLRSIISTIFPSPLPESTSNDSLSDSATTWNNNWNSLQSSPPESLTLDRSGSPSTSIASLTDISENSSTSSIPPVRSHANFSSTFSYTFALDIDSAYTIEQLKGIVLDHIRYKCGSRCDPWAMKTDRLTIINGGKVLSNWLQLNECGIVENGVISILASSDCTTPHLPSSLASVSSTGSTSTSPTNLPSPRSASASSSLALLRPLLTAMSSRGTSSGNVSGPLLPAPSRHSLSPAIPSPENASAFSRRMNSATPHAQPPSTLDSSMSIEMLMHQLRSLISSDMLSRFVEMGFSESRAIKALLINSLNVELAMDWLLEHIDDPELDEPLTRFQLLTLAREFRVLSLPPLTPELRNCISRNMCTYTVTGNSYVSQQYYVCHTCHLVDGKGCCVSCAQRCHNGHHLSSRPINSSRFFCDCGAGDAPSVCQALSPDPNSSPTTTTGSASTSGTEGSILASDGASSTTGVRSADEKSKFVEETGAASLRMDESMMGSRANKVKEPLIVNPSNPFEFVHRVSYFRVDLLPQSYITSLQLASYENLDLQSLYNLLRVWQLDSSSGYYTPIPSPTSIVLTPGSDSVKTIMSYLESHSSLPQILPLICIIILNPDNFQALCPTSESLHAFIGNLLLIGSRYRGAHLFWILTFFVNLYSLPYCKPFLKDLPKKLISTLGNISKNENEPAIRLRYSELLSNLALRLCPQPNELFLDTDLICVIHASINLLELYQQMPIGVIRVSIATLITIFLSQSKLTSSYNFLLQEQAEIIQIIEPWLSLKDTDIYSLGHLLLDFIPSQNTRRIGSATAV